MYKFILGVDVSKDTLDLCLMHSGGVIAELQLKNVAPQIKRLPQWLKKKGVDKESLLICLEHTGVYIKPLEHLLVSRGYHFCVEMPIKILRSMGLQRGKNDRVDALRIARYAHKNQEELTLYQQVPKIQQQLDDLSKNRSRLINCRKQLLQPVQELKAMGEAERARAIFKTMAKSVATIEKEIKQIDNQIAAMTKSDSGIEKNMELLQSIPGIGKCTALAVILVTQNFKKYFEARKLSCYCGCAPFEKRSGSSVRGKTSVSHMANKQLKKLLTTAALSAIRCNKEIGDYYERKVEEGKHKLTVINAVRNKLIHRMVAVINRDQPYVPANQYLTLA